MKNSVKGILIAAVLIILITILLKTCGGNNKAADANNEPISQQTSNSLASSKPAQQNKTQQPTAQETIEPEQAKEKKPVYKYNPHPISKISGIVKEVKSMPTDLGEGERNDWAEDKFREIERLVEDGSLHPQGAIQLHEMIALKLLKIDPTEFSAKMPEITQHYRDMSPLEIIGYE